MARFRVGAVSFLNALPLLDGLDQAAEVELLTATPARVADLLAGDKLDLGLVPVVEAARLGLTAVPGIGIAARGEVRSVLLLSRAPLAAVRTLALDPASRTSALLVRLLFRQSFGREPEVVAAPATGPIVPDGADAGLVIGDRALTTAPAGLERTDLAAWWHRRTGLPFVFAVWAGRAEAAAALAPLLTSCRDRGVARSDALADAHGPPRGIPREVARDYLGKAIVHQVGPDEERGLQLFLQLLRHEGLLPAAG